MAANRVLKITSQGEVRLYEAYANGQHYVALKAPASLAGSQDYTLPSADGSAGHLLTTNGSGVLSFTGTVTALTITTLTTDTVTVQDQGTVDFYEATGGGSNKISVQAPAALAGDWTLTLPPDNGNADEVLRTDGNGVTTWVATLTAFDIDALTSDGITLLNQGAVVFREATGGGTEAVTVQAPAALGASYTLTLPTTDGGANEFLQTDGSGNLSWASSTATMQSAYDNGEDVTCDAVVSTWSQANNNGILELSKSAVGAGSVLTVSNAGTGHGVDISNTSTGRGLTLANSGTGYGVYLGQSGAANALRIVQTGNEVALFISSDQNQATVQFNKTGAGAGAVIDIGNAGTGYDIDGTGSTWYATAGGTIKMKGLQGTGRNVTISGGAITVTAADYWVRLEGEGTANDFLDTINGGTDGQLLFLTNQVGARQIQLTLSGNLHTEAAATGYSSIEDTYPAVLLIYDSTLSKWIGPTSGDL